MRAKVVKYLKKIESMQVLLSQLENQTTDNYEESTRTMEVIQRKFRANNLRITSRIQELDTARQKYQEAIALRDTLIAEATKFGQQHAQTMRSPAVPSTDRNVFDNFSNEIKELAKSNYTVDTTDAIVIDTGFLQEKLAAMNLMVVEIKRKIIEQTQKIEVDIGQQRTAFNVIYANISKKLQSADLDVSDIKTVQEKFDRALAMTNTGNLDEVSFANDKRESADFAVRQLLLILPSQEQRVTDWINTRIAIIESDISSKSSEILGMVDSGGFVLNAEESILVQVVSDLKTLRDRRGSVNPHGIHEDRIEQQLALEKAIVTLRAVVATHQQAVAIIRSDSIDSLINKLNDRATQLGLLAALQQNLNLENLKHLLINLDNNLSKLNATGLAALSILLRDSQSPEVAPIKDKLLFIGIATAKAIQHVHLLTNPAAVASAIALSTEALNHLITQENLANLNFCQTVCLLKELNIELTVEKIQALADDQQKCTVIAQQAALHQHSLAPFSEQANESYLVMEEVEQRNKILPELFTALIEDFLKTDKAVAQALSNIIELEPQYAKHSLLVLVKESPELQILLADKHNATSAMPFLKSVLEQIKHHNQLFLTDYFSQNKTMQAGAEAGFKQVLVRNNTILAALVNAAKQPKCRLLKMSLVMTKLNEFITEQQQDHANDQVVLSQLSNFRRDAIPVLLTDKLMVERHTDLVKLANNTFKQSGILDRILEFIYTVFSVINLQLTASKTDRLFFSAQNLEAKTKLATGFQLGSQQVKASLKEINGEDDSSNSRKNR